LLASIDHLTRLQPLDLTLLDFHYGDIAKWRQAVDEIHRRGMYVVVDHTMSTMGDLIGFEGFLNVTTPFDTNEHKVLYKGSRQYLDFRIGNEYNQSCQYPRFYTEEGFLVGNDVTDRLKGCFNSDFDQYGDTEAFGVFPDWQRQLSKFASVQDRLREWVPSVRQRLERFSCMQIAMLDIDGFRFDKAVQITVDALGDFGDTVRQCAKQFGKDNFFMPGEITGGNTLGSVYIGRGRQPDQKPSTLSEALNLTSKSDKKFFIRDEGKSALDAAAFHYSIYRFLTRFLGMSGNLEAGFDNPPNWVDAWNNMLLTNDLVNVNTGVLDPRHMYGVTNQDVFRWPAVKQGTERMLLGMFITTLHMPGIPLVYYGEEQALYALDNTAENYIFGRQAMSSSPAWQLHGCYSLDSSQYKNWPIDAGRRGCKDETVGFDHRDPSHPVRNILKSMYHMRENYPALVDGLLLQKLSNQTFQTILDGSNVTASEFGVWSIARGFFPVKQDAELQRNTNIWLVYHNQDKESSYSFNCGNEQQAFISPFDAGSRVKNLFFPYDEIVLESSPVQLGFNGSRSRNGCVSKLLMQPFEFRAYVPLRNYVAPPPMVTKFTPGHDARLLSSSTVDISFHFNTEMDCNKTTAAVSIKSTTENGSTAKLDAASVKCAPINNERPAFVGAVPSVFGWSARLTDVADGVHEITLTNATAKTGGASTKAVDRFFIRIGQADNPVVFPITANYSKTLVSRDSNNDLIVSHKAAGATMWRYSTNWGSSWSDYAPYKGGQEKINILPWSGTARQAWQGDHVMAQYFSGPVGSSSMIQQGDFGVDSIRRFPHLFAHGTFNKFGFDAGIKNSLQQNADGKWELHYMDEWPSKFQINVWGINPDGRPDATFVMGDVDKDGVLDRISPASLAENVFNVTDGPPAPFVSFKMVLDDSNLGFVLEPQGNRWLQIAFFIVLAVTPVLGGLLAVWIFMGAFYKVKVVKIGGKKRGRSPFRKYAHRLSNLSFESFHPPREKVDTHADVEMGVMAPANTTRRTVLIATMEYNIDDWNIKIKIGGLGVMAQLMGKALEHQDLVWVVPCVGDVEYPVDEIAEPMYVTIMGKEYEIGVQYHRVANITYVLLDSDVFRQQTKKEPYPARMDDIESAVYYSAWNQAIAETTRRFPIDLYHINDYHGALAPLYLLPERTIPCALSLHNAEFQGLWPMRDPKEKKEVCEVFNLDQKIVEDYVQFGSVFNLLHAGASILRKHQRGFGAVGVSAKYGERSLARYPIFWGLKKIGQLPNPDPTDTAEWNPNEVIKKEDVVINEEFEASRGDLRRQAQEWAGLEVNPNAELFVFVGRWSLQKGVDLIADIFPAILEKNPDVQLICVGPVIDLYGKFAALKLSKLMEKYPKRVYSKPEFTSLPPYIFSGAEFALIPSRDEPFGLVAVEFGRKGALGVGARVGGLGQMPGFWYTIESTASHHLMHQFKEAIEEALGTNQKTRRKMRAWSAKQRFPVAQWLEQLEELQSMSIKIHDKEAKKSRRLTSGSQLSIPIDGQDRRHSRNSSLSRFFEDISDDADLTPPLSTAHSTSNSPRASRASSVSIPFLPPPTVSGGRSHRDSISSVETAVPQDHIRNFSTTSVNSLAVPEAIPRYPSGEGAPNYPYGRESHSASRLSVYNFKLQKVDPFFTDSTGEFYKVFEKRLESLTAKNSDSDLCIEEFLNKSEKEWFSRFRDAKLGRARSPSRSPAPSVLRKQRYSVLSRPRSTTSSNSSDVDATELREEMQDPGQDRDDEFLLGSGYKPPKGFKK
jgi:alpha-1,3-glucan synthase